MKKLLFAATMLLLTAGLAYAVSVSTNLSVQITSSSGGPVPPPEAANAGFTTLAANYDFSQPLYATQSNWLDCSGTDASSLPWHKNIVGGVQPTPCNIFQRADPANPSLTVLNLQYLQSYSSFGQTGLSNSVSMQTVTNGGTGQGGTATFSFPNGYVETVYRVDLPYPGNINRSNSGVWTWLIGSLPAGLASFEFDLGELYGAGGADGAASATPYAPPLWATWDFGCTYNPGCTSRLPSGYDSTQYHRYGGMWTSNGTNSTYLCGFIDGIFQACNPNPGAFSARSWLIAWIGAPDTGEVTSNLYIQYIRVWSCASWATTQCYGSTLVNGGTNGLNYWH